RVIVEGLQKAPPGAVVNTVPFKPAAKPGDSAQVPANASPPAKTSDTAPAKTSAPAEMNPPPKTESIKPAEQPAKAK
ncbi:MAG TPA: hypothetical protein PKJ17_07990, partial [Syntrophorhabdaceae bacterium]|nr:hypothetical protein [Syntrophorhabdaceae bacterium]